MPASRRSVMQRADRSDGHIAVQQRFNAAVDELVKQVREDRSILAAILCGSLSYDTVWEKSDVDLLFVTIDDRKIEATGHALYADGVYVHALLLPRANFRKLAEGALRNSFMHSFLARGRLLYTHDATIAQIFAGLTEIGERDVQLQLFRAATEALGSINKAHKWLLTRADLEYAALYILYAATPLARIEVIRAKLLADREVIPRALQLNAPFFQTIYTDLLNQKKTPAAVEHALAAVDAYIREGATTLFSPLLQHLHAVGETRSATDIEDHFGRNYGIENATMACEYLAEQGLIGKASVPRQLTRRSNVAVQELAFFDIAGRDGP
jgi:hypothetical protein